MIDKNKYRTVGGNVDRMWSTKDKPLNVNDSIEGAYVDKIENTGKKKNSTIHILEVGEKKERVGVWGGVVLDRRLSAIKIGSEVAVEYKGRVMSKDGNEYADYWVGVGHDGVDDTEEDGD